MEKTGCLQKKSIQIDLNSPEAGRTFLPEDGSTFLPKQKPGLAHKEKSYILQNVYESLNNLSVLEKNKYRELFLRKLKNMHTAEKIRDIIDILKESKVRKDILGS